MINLMIKHLSKLVSRMSNFIRILYHRSNGIVIPSSVSVGENSELEGNVVIGPNVRIGRYVQISGDVKIGEGSNIGHDVRIAGNTKIGRGSIIERDVHIVGNVDIGENTVVGDCTILSTMPKGYLKIGNDVLVNNFSVLGSCERVEIMDHCIFAAYVQITDAAHGFEDPTLVIKHAPFSTAPVTIEENVWLGSAVMIAKGVTVGEGSVIGAKSLVKKSIPPLSIAYGIPANVIKVRGE